MSTTKCRILYVDDHDDSAEMLKLLLAPMDYEVVTAGTLDGALELARTQQFDLYVLDKRLPDGSGLELCRRLNKMSPTVPCIFYTGDAYEVHRREAEEAGADAYVPKPDVEALLETVQKFLSQSECAAA
ncbi:MAG TPA: response regulator [Pyrinomonadaceae bacterium]|nr:response regulator [Pyrinomonadaceae bacterium]